MSDSESESFGDVTTDTVSCSKRKRVLLLQSSSESESDRSTNVPSSPHTRTSPGTKKCTPKRKQRRKNSTNENALADDLRLKESAECNQARTPGTRSSERLQKKYSREFSLPDRNRVLDKISPGMLTNVEKAEERIKALRPRRLVNNFIRERNSYVTERVADCYYSDESLSDFIVDADDSNDEEEESSTQTDASSEDSDESRKLQRLVNKRKSKKSKPLDSEEEEQVWVPKVNPKVECIESEGNDALLSKLVQKKGAANEVLNNSTCICSSDEELVPRTQKRRLSNSKKRNIIKDSSESETGEMGSEKCKEGNESSSDENEASQTPTKEEPTCSRPRSQRLKKLTQKQQDKHQQVFGDLLEKRQRAKLGPKEWLAQKQQDENSKQAELQNSEQSPETSDSENEMHGMSAIEVAAQLWEHSSDEDEYEKDFVVSNEEMSEDGMNSDGASEFLKLLDKFTYDDTNDDIYSVEDSGCRYRGQPKRKQRKKKKVTSKWNRIAMKNESNDSDNSDVNEADIQEQKRHLPLHLAVIANEIDSVKRILQQEPNCVYDLGHRKRTALHLAVMKGNVYMVKLLLRHRADCTALDSYHFPAIAYAANGHIDCLKTLLEHTDIKHINRALMKTTNGMSLLHFAVGESRTGLECTARGRCMELLFCHDKKACSRMLEHRDSRGLTPLVAAVYAGQHQCVAILLKKGANPLAYRTENGGSLLHFAVQCVSHMKEENNDSSLCLRQLLDPMRLQLNGTDENGFTALMYACESGNADCMSALINGGAIVMCADSHLTSALHLAAMAGDTKCVQLLLDSGHKVDCLDKYGWPPLLYANFKAHESCVLALMKPKPEQLFVLGNLLKSPKNDVQKKKAFKVVKNALISLANHDAYYTLFNDFVRANPEMLDENNHGLLQHTWRAILDFDNKHRWFKTKLTQLRSSDYMYHADIQLTVDRNNVLGSTMQKIGNVLGHALRSKSLSVTFEKEPGICTGPKKEFFVCLCKDVVTPERGLFVVTDDSQYSPVPNAYFAKLLTAPSLEANQQDTSSQPSSTSDYTDSGIQLTEVSGSGQSTRDTPEMFCTNECTDLELLSVLTHVEGLASGQRDQDEEMRIETGTDSQEVTSTPREGSVLVADSIESELSITVDNASSSMEQQETTQRTSSVSQELGNTWISCQKNPKDLSTVNLALRSKLKQLRLVGRLVGAAICNDMLLNLQLSKPFVKQVLRIPLSHPDDLSSFDYELHQTFVTWVLENSVDSLDHPFSIDVLNPWSDQLVTINLSDEKDKNLCDTNKHEFVKLVSQFKLQTSIKREVEEFAGGLYEVVPRDLLSFFTADEFSLLINGVSTIDVEDWKRNTLYQGCSADTEIIKWLWDTICRLKEEEKALLLKFSTGSPCVPLGGFAALQGLSGPNKFTIVKISGLNKIPHASTCFNMLKLTDYDSEKQLREKLLIAIRHGSEGFSFS